MDYQNPTAHGEKKMRRTIRLRWLKFGAVDEIKIPNAMIM